MNVPTPHYLLYSEASRGDDSGRWQFVLRTADGAEQFEAADVEPEIRGERLDLLTVVRALESLDQPSRVTLVGCSPYVRQGMQYGLPDWRTNGWRWEFYGEMVPVKNQDLWQRLDRVLRFHQVDCRRWRFDPPHGLPGEPAAAKNGQDNGPRDIQEGRFGIRNAQERSLRCQGRRLRYRGSAPKRRRLVAAVRLWRRRVAQSWEAAVRCPQTESAMEVTY